MLNKYFQIHTVIKTIVHNVVFIIIINVYFCHYILWEFNPLGSSLMFSIYLLGIYLRGEKYWPSKKTKKGEKYNEAFICMIQMVWNIS